MSATLSSKRKLEELQQDRKYEGLRKSLQDQLFRYGPPIFAEESADDDPSTLYDMSQTLIDKVIAFARNREDLILEANPEIPIQSISSECYIYPTKDMHSFAVVKTHGLDNPEEIVLYAFSIIKWKGEDHLLQMGRLFAGIKNVMHNGVSSRIANLSWIDTLEAKIQEFEDAYLSAQDSRERNIARKNMSSFEYQSNFNPQNKGIARALLSTFEGVGRRNNVDYAILESIPHYENMVDYQGNIVYEDDVVLDENGVLISQKGKPVMVDICTDILYSGQGFLKTGLKSPTGGIYMYRPLRAVHSDQLPENFKTLMFESFNYNTNEKVDDDSHSLSTKYIRRR